MTAEAAQFRLARQSRKHAWSAVHGLAALLVDGPRRADAQTLAAVEASAQGVTRTLIAGMLGRSPAAN